MPENELGEAIHDEERKAMNALDADRWLTEAHVEEWERGGCWAGCQRAAVLLSCRRLGFPHPIRWHRVCGKHLCKPI